MRYAPTEDRKGRAIHPGDRVRIKTYPKGTAEGIVVISSRRMTVGLDGSVLPALSVDVEGTLYTPMSSKGILKL